MIFSSLDGWCFFFLTEIPRMTYMQAGDQKDSRQQMRGSRILLSRPYSKVSRMTLLTMDLGRSVDFSSEATKYVTGTGRLNMKSWIS